MLSIPFPVHAGAAQIIASISQLSQDLNALTLEMALRKTAISLAHSDASIGHLKEIGDRLSVKVCLSRVMPPNPTAALVISSSFAQSMSSMA